jgi:hypothetical protein
MGRGCVLLKAGDTCLCSGYQSVEIDSMQRKTSQSLKLRVVFGWTEEARVYVIPLQKSVLYPKKYCNGIYW